MGQHEAEKTRLISAPFPLLEALTKSVELPSRPSLPALRADVLVCWFASPFPSFTHLQHHLPVSVFCFPEPLTEEYFLHEFKEFSDFFCSLKLRVLLPPTPPNGTQENSICVLRNCAGPMCVRRLPWRHPWDSPACLPVQVKGKHSQALPNGFVQNFNVLAPSYNQDKATSHTVLFLYRSSPCTSGDNLKPSPYLPSFTF